MITLEIIGLCKKELCDLYEDDLSNVVDVKAIDAILVYWAKRAIKSVENQSVYHCMAVAQIKESDRPHIFAKYAEKFTKKPKKENWSFFGSLALAKRQCIAP